jgi:hypothetical protein
VGQGRTRGLVGDVHRSPSSGHVRRQC